MKLFCLLICCLGIINCINITPYPKMVNIREPSHKISIISSAELFLNQFNGHKELAEQMQDIFEELMEKAFNKPDSCEDSDLNIICTKLNVIVYLQDKQIGIFKSLQFNTDVSYELLITENGQVIIDAQNYYGFVNAITTLIQLVEYDKTEQKNKIQTNVYIQDAPDFQHRGVMIDTSRHFIKKEKIIEIINGLMISKINVLHLHLTDSDSFPLELQSDPKVTKYGAFSQDQIYSLNDIKEIVKFAAKRGVRVIPEIDSPGHSISWVRDPAKIDLRVCEGYNRKTVAQEPPTGMIDPTKDKIYEMFNGIAKDVNTFFIDQQFHLGGDEVSDNCLDQKADIKTWMQAHLTTTDYNELIEYYTNKQRNLLKEEYTGIYWSKSDHNKWYTERNSDILQYWAGSESIGKIRANQKVILSPYNHYYLDCGMSSLYGAVTWCNPFNNWKRIIDFNPLEFKPKNDVLGGEVCIWAEDSHSDSLHEKLFTRSIAISERLWNNELYSSKYDGKTENEQTEFIRSSIIPRFINLENILTKYDIEYTPITSEYCSAYPKDCWLVKETEAQIKINKPKSNFKQQ